MINQEFKVIVAGACGKVGREITRALTKEAGFQLVGALDVIHVGEDIGTAIGIRAQQVKVLENLSEIIGSTKPDILVDFTNAQAGYNNIKAAIANGISVVVGTTGFSPDQIEEIHLMCEENQVGAVIAPNFAVGAVLMLRLAREAARWFNEAEIIELHHRDKVDAPSGTAIRTANLIKNEWESQNAFIKGKDQSTVETKLEVPTHSVRLQGLVAHQEIIFGTLGQTLTIRHDSYSRESFVPGVMLALRRVKSLRGVVFGLENLLIKN